MTIVRSLRFAPLALAVATFTAGLVALPSTARADRVRVRVGGDVHVRGRAHVRIGGPRVVVRPRAHRRYHRYHRYPRYRPYVYYRPYPLFPYWAPYWHYRYAAPPPPPCYAECAPVPAYYTAPQPAAVVTAAPRPPLSRFGIGLFGGAVGVENNDEPGAEIGLLARFRLTPHFLLEGELAKTELDEGVRVDRRAGAALLYDFAPWSPLSPYVLAGGGVGDTDISDGFITDEHVYGELGIGLKLALGRHFSLFGDLRGGVRASDESDTDEPIVFTPRPGSPGTSIEEEEGYTRGRIGLLLSF